MGCCALPPTGAGCVAWVYATQAVIDILGGQFILGEKVASLSFDNLQSLTGATLKIEDTVANLFAPEL